MASVTDEELTCNNCLDPVANTLFVECADCHTTVREPTLSTLPVRLCAECFACGAELGSHKANHRYYVKNQNDKKTLRLFHDGNDISHPWTSQEELGLLEGIERYNLGNWEDIISHYVKNCDTDAAQKQRSAKEARQHYDHHFLHGPIGVATVDNQKRPDDLDHTAGISGISAFSPPIKEPLRKISTDDFRLLAYMPQRDDYEKEFNNDAETLISNLMILPDDDELDQAVKLSQIDMYICEILERRRRKAVARDYTLVPGFLKHEKSCSSKVMYSYSVQDMQKLRVERELRDQMKKFSQFLPAGDFDQLVSDLVKERSLKERIQELQDYRKRGLTTLEGEKSTKERKSSSSKRQSSEEEKIDVCDSRTVPKRTLTGGTECASGRSVLRRITTDGHPLQSHILSHSENQFCTKHNLSKGNYLLLKAVILKEQAAKWNGVSYRTLGCNEDLQQLKTLVKDFMKCSGWLPYFS